ncbi:sigma factor-like helix-turn-helix DNA-binding protein [Dactylosporangium darangshiense]|uniref:sigma factor-like helix-turn-helix DNA-binding protein n=1 Tax=Dactylosporangium darangshiense TaxID=579108 RepID=UPI00362BE9B8
MLVLRFWADLSVEQTAAALDCAPGTVKSQTSDALANLRRTLGAALDDLRPNRKA